MKVLIADDNRDSADSLATLIHLEFGCYVDTAYDGTQALELARLTTHDVLILDLEMPGLSGLQVATQASQGTHGNRAPLLLAVTGRSDQVDDLALIEARFDRAFAKPIDHTGLYATVSAHWKGTKRFRAPSEFKIFDILTKATRELLVSVGTNRQQISYDADGPELVLYGDEVAMHSAFYRLICGALDLMGNGIVMVAADSSEKQTGGHSLTINIAGSERIDKPSHLTDVLHRLGLVVGTASPTNDDAGGFVYAHGACPNSGGEISFASHPVEGVLLRLELEVNPIGIEPQRRAERARAWIVDTRHIESAVLERRLQRLGWRVWRYSSAVDLFRAVSAADVNDLPELLLISNHPVISRSNLAHLRSRMPERTRCVLLVGAGSSALLERNWMPNWEVRVEPLSPSELFDASSQAQNFEMATAGLDTISHSLSGRRRVLVVDDIEVNRIVACGLLRVLGYEVAAVADGLDAIEHCKHMPPDLVLMDVNMPVLGGIDASRRIVELQRLGRVAPFAIVMATADDSPETAARCYEAGVVGYLSKPLRLEMMRDELRRVGVPSAID